MNIGVRRTRSIRPRSGTRAAMENGGTEGRGRGAEAGEEGEELRLGGDAEREMFARIDTSRMQRTGVPEAVFCPSKTPTQIATIMRSIVNPEGGRRAGREDDGAGGARYAALATRMEPAVAAEIARHLPQMRYHHACNVGVLWRDELQLTEDAVGRESAGYTYVPSREYIPPPYRIPGKLAVVSAGTADQCAAHEAICTAEVFGITEVRNFNDVGVAGLHRLMRVIDSIRECDVVVVVAGMDGCLPSVVAGLIDAPVVAVPTSVGYGVNLHGLSSLLTSLNSCAPGVSVVNVDNGFGAATVAIKMLRRAAEMHRRARCR